MSQLEVTLQRIDTIQQTLRQRFASDDSAASTFQSVLDQTPGVSTSIASTSPQPALALKQMIEDKASQNGLASSLVTAVVRAESGFNANAVSPVGAQGLMQLMPGTAKTLGVSDSLNPAQNLDGGSRYLKGLINRYQSVPKALAAYNAGPAAVDKYNGIPPYNETQQYVRKVLQYQQQYQQQAPINNNLGGAQ